MPQPREKKYITLFSGVDVNELEYSSKLLVALSKYSDFQATPKAGELVMEHDLERGQFQFCRKTPSARDNYNYYTFKKSQKFLDLISANPDKKEDIAYLFAASDEYRDEIAPIKKESDYMMSINSKLADKVKFDASGYMVYDAHLECNFTNGLKDSLHPLLFQWSDDLAQVTQPRFGVCQIFFDGLGRKWENERERNSLWMYHACYQDTLLFHLIGPKGLGMRTYFGGDILTLFGREFLLSAPGIVRELPWGGISIDLCDKPWEKTQDELLDPWVEIMNYLEPAQVMARPIFAHSEDKVFLIATDCWKKAYKHRIY